MSVRVWAVALVAVLSGCTAASAPRLPYYPMRNGEPLAARFALPAGARFVSVAIGGEETRLVLASDFGYGFVAAFPDLIARNQKGRAVLKLPEGASALPAVPLEDPGTALLAAVTDAGFLLVLEIGRASCRERV